MDKFDDIVFKYKNREYGAYQIRKKNTTFVIVSFIISVVLFCTLIFSLYVYEHSYENHIHKFSTYIESTIFKNPYLTDNKQLKVEESAKSIIKNSKLKIVEGFIFSDSLTKENLTNGQDSNSLANGNFEEIQKEVVESNKNINNDTTINDKLIMSIEKLPMFQGGENARIAFIQNNIKYPSLAMENNIEGIVFVNFIVESDSSITHIVISKGIGWGCDEEVIRLINSMPKWIPCVKGKKPIRCQLSMPINFTLNSVKD
ncbi:MAG: energy transducer TonB [Bacteroidales bacterium]